MWFFLCSYLSHIKHRHNKMEGWLKQVTSMKNSIWRNQETNRKSGCFHLLVSDEFQVHFSRLKNWNHSCCGLWLPVHSSAFCCFSAVAHNCDNHNPDNHVFDQIRLLCGCSCLQLSHTVGYAVTVTISFSMQLITQLQLPSIFPFGRLLGYCQLYFFKVVISVMVRSSRLQLQALYLCKICKSKLS